MYHVYYIITRLILPLFETSIAQRMTDKELSEKIIQHGDHTHTALEARENSGYILSIILGVFLVSQTGIYFWKKYYHTSFLRVSTFGLWIIPGVWSLHAGFYRMVCIWSVFSFFTARTVWMATRKPVDNQTPRRVYSFFYFVYRFFLFLTIGGYLMIASDFFGISLVVSEEVAVEIASFGVYIMFYGLYFGVLGRDFAIHCTQIMAANMGYYKKDGMPTKVTGQNICGICNNALYKNLRLGSDQSQNEKVFRLSCEHEFHESCIRGWLIVGKRDTCARCSEKVNLKDVVTNPWERHSVTWGIILDCLRYIIVFNPIIIITMQVVLYLLY